MNYELAKEKTGGYQAIHAWLRYHFGSASRCENLFCEGSSKRFEWALRKGHEHGHHRERYWQLCKQCHMAYDGIAELTSKRFWRGGKPDCTDCGTLLSQYRNKTGLCIKCKNKKYAPWLGRSRREANLAHV